MEKEIKKLVELAKRIIMEIDDYGIANDGWHHYGDSVYHYESGKSIGVDFEEKGENIFSYRNWLQTIEIHTDSTAKSLSKLHDRIEKEWNEYITTTGEEERPKVISKRQQRIKELQKELELLTNKQ